MTSTVTNKKMFSLRDLIWFCSLVGTFSAGYFPMKAKVNRNSETLDKYNLELIQYKQNEIYSKVDKLDNKFSNFIDAWNEYRSHR